MTNILTIVSNATVAKVLHATREDKMMISKWLSCKVEGAEFSKRGGSGSGWDGRKSFFSFRAETFPAGFARLIVANLKRKGFNIHWVKSPLPMAIGPTRPEVDAFGYSDKYDYQPETVDRLIRYGQMVAKVATGGGKSRIARIAFKRIQRKTLFITTRGQLMYQMRDDFVASLNEKVGVLGDGEWSESEGFNVAMVQTLSQRIILKNIESELERVIELELEQMAVKRAAFVKNLNNKNVDQARRVQFISAYNRKLMAERKSDSILVHDVTQKVKLHNIQRTKLLAFLATIEFIILEEAHEVGGDGFFNVCMACKNAHYRLSLTATAFMRESEEDNFRLMAVSGPIGIDISEKKLIDLGVLATPKFFYEKVSPVKQLYRTSPYTKAIDKGVVNNEGRNATIVERCKQLNDYGLTSMILVNRKLHGENLKKQLTANGLKVAFIYGDKKQSERKEQLRRLGTGLLDVLIGTTILDVGVDVPSVGAIMLAGGGKTEIGLRQRVGRGLRAKKKGPNICFVFDFQDVQNEHLKRHYVARRKIIQETKGFGENIIQELTLEDHGFKRKNK